LPFDFLNFYFPIVSAELNVGLLFIAGILTGIITGMFGLGGGFIVIPTLSFYGLPISLALTTSANQMIAGSLTAFITNTKNKNVDFKLVGQL